MLARALLSALPVTQRRRTRASEGPPTQRIEFHIATGTIVKLLLTALLVYIALRLFPQVLLIAFSLLVAVALGPVVNLVEHRGIPRWVAVAALGAIAVGVIVSIVAFVVPPLASQLSDLTSDLPQFHDRVVGRISPHGFLRKVVDQAFEVATSGQLTAKLKQPLEWGMNALSIVMSGGLMFVLALYLLLDGKRLYAWLLAYVPRAHRAKMAVTVPAMSKVVYAYVRGLAITSTLAGVYSAAVLTIAGVPAVVPLAILAAACDVIPVVGIIIATVPAALLALSTSPGSALAVIVLYISYHMFETYVIVPKVYGQGMRLSTLTVVLAFVFGGSLLGIVGALLVLPLVAAYPIIERIWLRNYLSPEVIHDHKALEEAEEEGSDEAIEKVLLGEKHPEEPSMLPPRPSLESPTRSPV